MIEERRKSVLYTVNQTAQEQNSLNITYVVKVTVLIWRNLDML